MSEAQQDRTRARHPRGTSRRGIVLQPAGYFANRRASGKEPRPAISVPPSSPFCRKSCPWAEELGLRLAIHPDDPPWPLFGLPRVVSTAGDARSILAGVGSPANGLTFCVGSYGARADNDLLAMAGEFASRIHFAHLRQVVRETDGSFHEAEASSRQFGYGRRNPRIAW